MLLFLTNTIRGPYLIVYRFFLIRNRNRIYLEQSKVIKNLVDKQATNHLGPLSVCCLEIIANWSRHQNNYDNN